MTAEPTTTAPDDAAPTENTQTEQEAPTEATSAANTRASSEAAKYRLKAREAQALLDDVTRKYEALQRSVVGDTAKRLGFKNPESIWQLGFDLGTVTTEDGGIDLDATTDALKEIADTTGIHTSPQPVPKAGMGRAADDQPSKWSSAF